MRATLEHRHRGSGTTEAELERLGAELRRLRREARRLHRRYLLTGDQDAWQRWSNAVSDVEQLRHAIVETPTKTMTGILVRFDAVRSMLLDDNVIMDEVARREVERFGRMLRKVGRLPDI